MSRTAACHCGQLTAVCYGEPVRVSVCHCLACQQRTGSVFGVAARFNEDQVHQTGRVSQWTRVGDEGASATFDFCPDCGTNLLWRNHEFPGVIAVAVGCFADPSFPPPIRTVYEDRAHPWLDLKGVEEWHA